MLPAADAASQPSPLPSQVKCATTANTATANTTTAATTTNPMFEPTPLSRVETPPFDEAHDCISLASTPVQQSSTITSPSICSQSNIDDLSPHLSHSHSHHQRAASAAHMETVSFDLVNSACEYVGAFLEHCCTVVSCGPPNKCTFDALCEPKIPITAYFNRIRQYSQATPESIICALVLMRKIYLRHFVLTNFNVHRLLIASVMVFAKYYDDETDSNARWARIAGLKKCELNNLEVEFLNLCHFDLRVSSSAFHDMVMELIEFRTNPPSPSDRASNASATCGGAATATAAKKKSSLRIFHSRHTANNSSNSGINTAPSTPVATSSSSSSAAAKDAHSRVLERTHTADEASRCKTGTELSMFHTSDSQSMMGQVGRVQCPTSSEGGFFYAPSVPVTPSDCGKKKMPRNTSLHSIAGLLQKSPSIFKRKHKHHDHDQADHPEQQQHHQHQHQASHVQPTL